jgi:hypothetical protein
MYNGMQDKSETKEVDWSFLLGTRTANASHLTDANLAEKQLLPSVFYSQEEIKTLLDAYIHSQRNAWANSIVG